MFRASLLASVFALALTQGAIAQTQSATDPAAADATAVPLQLPVPRPDVAPAEPAAPPADAAAVPPEPVAPVAGDVPADALPPVIEAPVEATQAPVEVAQPPVDPAASAAEAPVTLPVPRPVDPLPAIAAPPGTELGTGAPLAGPSVAMVPASTQPETIGRINNYLNSIHVMSGTFTQLGPDGTRTTGKFYISKPGRLRFQYDPPSPVELIADGRSVAIRDRKLNTQDLYLIGQTPLRFLLQDNLDLMTDTSVVGVTVEPDLVSVTMQEDSAIGGSAQIILMFSGIDYSLKQWTVTDAQGYQTTVAIYDIDTVSVPNDKLFYINEMIIK